ncbi:MAG: FAD-dependent oxidoreductase [Burkholderiaceae bacterium]
MNAEQRADVVVIGGGGAGLAAASEARRAGSSVILLEKNPELGGSTAWSIGSVTAINTPHQRRAGITDSADEHFEDLGLLAGKMVDRDNLALRRVLVNNTNETFTWLMSLGIVFLGPMPEPPNRYPRMHNIVPNSRAFPYHLGRHCRKLGVDIQLGMAARHLIEEDGRVIGVEVENSTGEVQKIFANRAVILATGDFSGGAVLKRRFGSELAALTDAVNLTNTGDGHAMAMKLGAIVVNGDIIRGPVIRFVPPTHQNLVQKLPPNTLVGHAVRWSMNVLPDWLLRPFVMSFITTALGPEPLLYEEGAIIVNSKGERFTNELATPAMDLPHQPDGIGYIILDARIAKKFTAYPYFLCTAPGTAYAYLPDFRRNRRDIYVEAPDLESLATALHMPISSLKRTVQESGKPLNKAPYVALGPIRSYVTLTDGGLKVTTDLQVLGHDDRPIPGLYAAGATGQGGLLLYGHGHHLMWSFVSGRIAGLNAACAAQLRLEI